MGDIIHALPALASLKETFPEWEVDWLVERRWRDLLDGNGCLEQVLDLDTLRWRTTLLSPSAWKESREAINALRRRGYDWALDLQGAFKSALACSLSGATRIAGFAGVWLREPGASVLYSRRVSCDAIHAVEANMTLAAVLGAQSVPSFPLPPGNALELPKVASAGEFAVVNPGAGWPAKQWTITGYAALCEVLERDYGLSVILNCGPGEAGLINDIRVTCKSAHPQLFKGTTAGLIALLRRARVMVGPDTGPVHLAAALGVPTLGLYGPTDPRRNGPYGERMRTLRHSNAVTSHDRAGPGDDSMRRIQLPEVLAAVRDLLTPVERPQQNRPDPRSTMA
jgi:lipopolysaccharide heptosyltransferase I